MLAINDGSYHAELKTKSEAGNQMDTHLDSRGPGRTRKVVCHVRSLQIDLKKGQHLVRVRSVLALCRRRQFLYVSFRWLACFPCHILTCEE